MFALTVLASLFFAAPTFAYNVEKGDTMTEIAKEHGLTLKELAKANPHIEDLDLIIVGQQIKTETTSTSSQPLKESNSNKTKKVMVPETKVSSSNEKVSISEDEIDLLARIVRAEAQTEPFEGKVAVASVVLNRVESSQFPNTIKKVIYQPGQFQPVSNGAINKPADKQSIKAVRAALSDLKNIAKDSLFFYNPKIATNRWLDTRKTTVVIGQHVFKK
jgi:N-acetylmuramoyl-L-alanine amidase